MVESPPNKCDERFIKSPWQSAMTCLWAQFEGSGNDYFAPSHFLYQSCLIINWTVWYKINSSDARDGIFQLIWSIYAC